jgi:hypothetical protein
MTGKRETRGRSRYLFLLALPVALGCGDGEDEGEAVSYERDVKPLFARRCVPCHHSANETGIVDIEDPFTQDVPAGLVGSSNVWAEGHPGHSPELNLVPFEPENSFVMMKITDRELLPGACDPATTPRCKTSDVGTFMPAQQGKMAPESIAEIRQWITDGAEDTEFFRSRVARLFGDPYSDTNPHPCGYCHYPGGPDFPHFTQPFDPVEGIVNVDARFRPDLKLVEPGNPDDSFLIIKLEATELTSEFGAPMPRNYDLFSDEQVSTIERWIIEGARNN